MSTATELNLCAGSWWPGDTRHELGPDYWTHGDGNRWCWDCARRRFGLVRVSTQTQGE